ncbi:MAG: hypothetical protein ACRDKZ_07730 [Actinomycetota bacterium]
MKRATASALCIGTALAATLLAAPVALADKAKPLVTVYAWYWEDQQQESIKDPDGNDALTVTAGNPWCPGAEGFANPEQTCKPGRLPVEVQGGDYETPNKVAAASFDLSIAPIGSTIKKFTATFLEAADEQSQPFNAEGHELEACPINVIFGGGEARRYKEIPKFECDKSSPITAKRKPVKAEPSKKKDDAEAQQRFEWTFDLTAQASEWVKKGDFATGIMIRPFQPKKPAPSDNNWRVVLEGPESKGGITTFLDFVPAKVDALGSLGSTGSSGTTGSSISSGGSGLGSTSGGFSSSAGSGSSTVPGSASGAATDAQGPSEAAEEPKLASDELGEVPGGLPGYVWAGLLAAIAGFSLLRSVVLDQQAGIRPNGVLAQIRRLNAERRGAISDAQAASVANPLAGFVDGLKVVGGKVRGAIGRLPLKRKA